MRVFVAGATGVIGQYLVPSLVTAGHEVTGTTRSTARAASLQAAGATPVIVDGLDRRAVLDAGPFYGHGASGVMVDAVRKRQMPVVGGGTGIWSFCAVVLMTEARGASNAKARRELAWAPQYASWRDGFRDWAKTAGQAHAA